MFISRLGHGSWNSISDPLRISGDVGDAEFTAKHGTLVEVCAQLSSERGGGSLSALTVYDITTSGEKWLEVFGLDTFVASHYILCVFVCQG